MGISTRFVGSSFFLWGLIQLLLAIRQAFQISGFAAGAGSLAALTMTLLIALPLLQQSHESGHTRLSVCRNNLKQIGLGLHLCQDATGSLPETAIGTVPRSWRVDLLPYLDRSHLRNEYDDTTAWDSESNTPVSMVADAPFFCPSEEAPRDDQRRFFSAFAAISGDGGVFSGQFRSSFSHVPDGNAHTIAVIEACGQRIVWTEPRDVSLSDTPIGINLDGSSSGRSDGLASARHATGPNVLFVDGRVKSLSPQTDPKVLKAMATANGSEPLDDF